MFVETDFSDDEDKNDQIAAKDMAAMSVVTSSI